MRSKGVIHGIFSSVSLESGERMAELPLRLGWRPTTPSRSNNDRDESAEELGLCSKEEGIRKGWRDKMETRTLHWERETEEPHVRERNRKRKQMSRGTPSSGSCH